MTTLTAREVDTQLADIYGRVQQVEARLSSLQSRDYRNQLRGSQAEIDAQWDALKALQAEAAPFEAIYRANPWTRVFLVGGGHAHSSLSCHTCYPTTQFSWLPEWSGKDEAAIIDAAGDRACTVCYPNAPVDKPTQLYTPAERKDAAQRAAEAQRRAAKAAEKAAKAITYRGGVLRGHFGPIATERTAWVELVDLRFSAKAYDYDPHDDVQARIVEALSDKLGISPDEINAQAAVKLAAKEKREARA